MHRYLVFDDDLLRQKRLLVANTEMITEDRQLNVAHLNGKPEVITGVQDLFSRMKAVPTITVDLYPVQIPIFCCTRFLLLFPKKNFLKPNRVFFTIINLGLEWLRRLISTHCSLMRWNCKQEIKMKIMYRWTVSNRVAFQLDFCGDISW